MTKYITSNVEIIIYLVNFEQLLIQNVINVNRVEKIIYKMNKTCVQ